MFAGVSILLELWLSNQTHFYCRINKLTGSCDRLIDSSISPATLHLPIRFQLRLDEDDGPRPQQHRGVGEGGADEEVPVRLPVHVDAAAGQGEAEAWKKLV